MDSIYLPINNFGANYLQLSVCSKSLSAAKLTHFGQVSHPSPYSLQGIDRTHTCPLWNTYPIRGRLGGWVCSPRTRLLTGHTSYNTHCLYIHKLIVGRRADVIYTNVMLTMSVYGNIHIGSAGMYPGCPLTPEISLFPSVRDS